MPLISSDTDSAGSRSSVPHATSSRLLAGPIPLEPRGFGLTAAGLLRFPGESSLCRPRRHRVTRAVLRDLRNRLDQLAVNTAPGAEIAAAAPTRSHWVIPELVAEDPSPNEHEIGGYAILSFSACMRSRDGSNIKRCARNEARSERRLDRFIGRRHRQVRGYRRGGVYRRGEFGPDRRDLLGPRGQ